VILNGSIAVPWGPDGSLELTFPPAGTFADDIEVVLPDLSGPLADYPSALEQALDSPEGSARLEDLVAPGASVAIVVDDPSRWTPVSEALPIILRRLHEAGVRLEDVTISVGVGRHHAVDDESMRRRLGDSVAASYRCFSPPVDDRSAYVDLGETPQGVPVRVFRPVAQASLRILVGSVLPHLQAGFGGGYKLIFPGTSHRTTLGALHRQGLEGRSDASGLMGSAAADNPMRQAIHAAASRIGPCWSISHLIGGLGQCFRIVAGHPEHVQDLIASEVKRRFQAPAAAPVDLIVVGNNPWPGDPMQSFKVLLHHRVACRPGGVLVGLFWTDPREIDRSFPITALRRIAATGTLGGWTICRLLPMAQRITSAAGSPAAFMLRWARELVVDRSVLVYAPPLYERIGPRLGPVRLFDDQAALWQAAAIALDCRDRRTAPRVLRVFPQGGLTYVPR
jgi:lactate racemase